jgi:hypothetical protein
LRATDDRWKPHPRPTLTKTHLWDEVNGMYATTKGLCGPGVLGVLYSGRTADTAGNEERRTTMSLCNRVFDRTGENSPAAMSDVPADKDLSKLDQGVSYFSGLISATILHEVRLISDGQDP